MTNEIDRARDIRLPDRTSGERTAARQRRAFGRLLSSIPVAEWESPTECERWRVRDMVAHVVAATDLARRPWRYPFDVRAAQRRYPGDAPIDAYNEHRIDLRRGCSPRELLDALERMTPLAAPPRIARRLPVRGYGLPSYATIGYFADAVLVRDVYMHRLDVGRAVGAADVPDASDADVVEQVVRDLGLAWQGPSVELRLSGPGGGAWLLDVPDRAEGRHAVPPSPSRIVEAPAAEFMRHLSGREAAIPAIASGDADVDAAIGRARVLF